MLSPIQQENLNRLKEVHSMITDNLTRKEFVATNKQFLALIKKIESDLTAKVDEKLGTVDPEIESARQAVEEIKSNAQALIKEIRDSNDTTLASLKKKALENIDALFTRMRLQDKFDSVLSEYQGKIEELDDKISSIPTAEEIRNGIIIPEPKLYTAEEVRNLLAALVGDERLDWTAIKGLEEKFTALTDSKSLGGLSSLVSTRTRFVDDENLVGTLNGVNSVFTISKTPISGSVKIFRGGSRQRVGEDYTISNRTITFIIPPVVGEILLADFRW